MSSRQIRFAGQEVTGVAVAVCRMPQGHTHSGVLYRHTNGRLCLVHLRWDCDLAHEVFDGVNHRWDGGVARDLFEGSYAWVIPDLLPEEMDDVRAVCRDLVRRMPTIHYSFLFDPEATLNPQTSEVVSAIAPYGLTCSTFVLAVFNSAQVQMVHLTGWQSRPDDHRWYAALLRYLGKTGVDPVHIARIQSNVQCLRVRPEEVAGACLASRDNIPAGYDHCEPAGRDVLRLLAGHADASLNRYSTN